MEAGDENQRHTNTGHSLQTHSLLHIKSIGPNCFVYTFVNILVIKLFSILCCICCELLLHET